MNSFYYSCVAQPVGGFELGHLLGVRPLTRTRAGIFIYFFFDFPKINTFKQIHQIYIRVAMPYGARNQTPHDTAAASAKHMMFRANANGWGAGLR
jgi:hypothetical protein